MFRIKNAFTESLYSAQAFIRNNPIWLLQGVTCLAIVGAEAYVTYQGLMDGDSSIYYKAARTLGAAIKVITLATTIPLSRVSYTDLQNSALGDFLALDNRIMDHKIFSSALIAISAGHGIAHFFNNSDVFFRQSGISGMLMFSSITILPLTGMIIFKRFGTTLQIHRIGAALSLGGYLTHTPDYRLIKYAAAASLPFLIDRWREHFYFTHHTKVTDACIVNDTDFISLEILKPANFGPIKPGQYARLSLKSINAALEPAHPFTIAQTSEKSLKFLIRRHGEWTKTLYDVVSKPNREFNDGIISGPFGRSLLSIIMKSSVTFIGTGIGITPLISVLDYIMGADPVQLPKPVALHIVQRKTSEVQPCLEVIKQIDVEKEKAIKSIDIYLTREPEDQISAKQLISTGIFASKIKVHHQRPDLNVIAKAAEVVHVCGSQAVVDEVKRSAGRFGKPCYNETF